MRGDPGESPLTTKRTNGSADTWRMFSHEAESSQPTVHPLKSELTSDAESVQLVRFFIGELESRLGALSDAFETGHLTRLALIGQELKEAAGGYGYPEIASAAAALENSLSTEPLSMAAVREKADSLIALLHRAIAANTSDQVRPTTAT